MSRPGRLRFASSHRDKLLAANASNSFYASMAGEKLAPELTNDIKPKRAYTKREDDDQESLVIQAVSDLLKAHPDVCFAVRQNTGAVQSGDARYWFYRILRAPVANYDITLTDFWGLQYSGLPFALECKRPSWSGIARTDREVKQEQFIQFIQTLGGRAGFATSVVEARAILAGHSHVD